MSTQTSFLHFLPERATGTHTLFKLKLFCLLILAALYWHLLPLTAVAAPAPVEAAQLMPVAEPLNGSLPHGQITETEALTTSLPISSQTGIVTGNSVCPVTLETDVADQGLLAGSFLNVASTVAGVFAPEAELKERVNILLLGSDSRPGEKYGHTDTMILVTVDPISKTAGMLSIPRDLWVSIPGYGENRINQAYRLGEINQYPGGGLALVKATLEANLGVPVDFYALIDFEGFKQVIDTLGGIEVCVPETIDAAAYYGYTPQFVDPAGYYSYVPETPAAEATPTAEPEAGLSVEAPIADPDKGYKFLYIEAGLHTLDGETALQYARSRASVTADFARVQRQQTVLLAIKAKALQLGLLPKIPELWSAMSHVVVTDLQLADLMQLAQLAAEISPDQIQTGAISHAQTMNYKTSSGAQVLLPRREEIKALLVGMFGTTNPTAELTQLELAAGQTQVEANSHNQTSGTDCVGCQAQVGLPEASLTQ